MPNIKKQTQTCFSRLKIGDVVRFGNNKIIDDVLIKATDYIDKPGSMVYNYFTFIFLDAICIHADTYSYLSVFAGGIYERTIDIVGSVFSKSKNSDQTILSAYPENILKILNIHLFQFEHIIIFQGVKSLNNHLFPIKITKTK